MEGCSCEVSVRRRRRRCVNSADHNPGVMSSRCGRAASSGDLESRDGLAQLRNVSARSHHRQVGPDQGGGRPACGQPPLKGRSSLDLDSRGSLSFQSRPQRRRQRYGGHQKEAASCRLVEPTAVCQKGVGAQASGQCSARPRPNNQSRPAQARRFAVEEAVPQAGDPVQPWGDGLAEQVTGPAALGHGDADELGQPDHAPGRAVCAPPRRCRARTRAGRRRGRRRSSS